MRVSVDANRAGSNAATTDTRELSNEQRKLAKTVLIVAFIVKALLLFAVLPLITSKVAPQYTLGFVDLYDMIGLNVAQGAGYRVEPETTITMIREPGYPLFLAGLFKIAGYHIEAARVANLLLSIGIAWMLIRLAREITGDMVVALLATLVFLFYPGTLLSEARGGIEISFIFLLMLFMLALHRAAEQEELWRYLLAGALLGVVVQFRGTPLLFPAFVFGCFVLAAKTRAERFQAFIKVAVLVLAMGLVMTPWIIRNYQLSGRFVPTATVQGIAAQEGQFTCQRLGPDYDFVDLQDEAAAARFRVAGELGVPFKGPYYQIFYSPQAEIAFNQRLMADVGAANRANPLLVARCAAQNLFFNFWFLGKSWKATALNGVVQLPLLVLALGGVYVMWRSGQLRKIALIGAFITYIVAVHSVIIAHARHSVPLIPFLSILASIFVVKMWRAYTGRTDR